MSMNALDTALVRLAAASTALEYTAHPGLKDVETAKKEAKAASEILDAAHRLMSYGVYTVADAPMEPGVPLPFEAPVPDLVLPEIQEEAPTLLPRPEVLALFATWDEEEQLREFELRLDGLGDKVVEANPDAETDYDPWDAAWDADRQDAFLRLVIAGEREPVSFSVLTDEERDAWLAAHEPVPDQEDVDQVAEPTPALTLEQMNELFTQKLEELEEAGVKEAGLKRKGWKKAETAWRAAYAENPTDTLDAILWRLMRPVIAWEIPSREEVAA